ncbi:unnamed protein product [Chondrus crispus]|uniref:PPM-type phosphatase domain-containing protein n=1 Tax=Chondrus crispus TaxID=2769 RepID=R7Q6A9_CHOCR|nr:unnamed protein product [Chondrus crispus]CDF34072.1 unnamed protein product [Chondrus crispus]|eukprot:XP_005713891.1 unnamed protein product [Chondrus crispus]
MLVLASDGLWDFVNEQEVAAVVVQGGELEPMATALVDLAVKRGSKDDTSVVLVRLGL